MYDIIYDNRITVLIMVMITGLLCYHMITGRKTGIMITEIKSCKILKLFNLPIMMKEY